MIPHDTTKGILQEDNSGKETNFSTLQEVVKQWKQNLYVSIKAFPDFKKIQWEKRKNKTGSTQSWEHYKLWILSNKNYPFFNAKYRLKYSWESIGIANIFPFQ